jgi:N6-L-threonylcarbamoyladenine synthase
MRKEHIVIVPQYPERLDLFTIDLAAESTAAVRRGTERFDGRPPTAAGFLDVWLKPVGASILHVRPYAEAYPPTRIQRPGSLPLAIIVLTGKRDLYMRVLGIESSCDDTAAAVLDGGTVRSNVISSQHDLHDEYGGVVPELASRDHQRLIVPVVQKALTDAGVRADALDAVAVTYGPGLPGSLLVGLSFAKAFARGLNVPLIGVNHLEGHLYSGDLEPPVPPRPYLCLVVSGGHTELISVEDGFRHTVLGRTRDDAAGEAFDKIAQLFDLGYPGGPEIDEHAAQGDPTFHDFPRTQLEDLDFSFSGLKTSVLYYLRDFSDAERERVLADHLDDLCASVQAAIVDVLVDAVRRAVDQTDAEHVAVVGGVAANRELRRRVEAAGEEDGFTVYVPALSYCMDNAAMIAKVGALRLAAGGEHSSTLDVTPQLHLG